MVGTRQADPAKPDDATLQQAHRRDALAGTEFGAYRKAIEKNIKIKIVNPPATETAPTPES